MTLRSMRLRVKYLVLLAALNNVDNKIPDVNSLVKEKNAMQKYETLNLDILPHLVIINLQTPYSMQR